MERIRGLEDFGQLADHKRKWQAAGGAGDMDHRETSRGQVGTDLHWRRQVPAEQLYFDLAALAPAQREHSVGVGKISDLQPVEILRLRAELGIVHRDIV